MKDQTKNRETAGVELANRIRDYSLTNAVVIGIPHGGVCVASSVAEQLNLPLEVMICRTLTGLDDEASNVGSVSANEVYRHDLPQGQPADSLYFQAIRLQSEISFENDFYYGRESHLDLEHKTVILIDDILTSPDTMIACLREIRKQTPLKVIVGVPFVQAEAARVIRSECDDLIFLKLQQNIQTPHEYYEDFPVVQDWTVRELLNASRRRIVRGF